MIKQIATAILVTAIVIAGAYALEAGLEKQDRVTCLKLQKQSQEYATFYATQAEQRMCAEYRINLGR